MTKTINQTIDWLPWHRALWMVRIKCHCITGGSSWNDVTATWPKTWAWAIGGSSLPSMCWGCTLLPPQPQWELLFKDTAFREQHVVETIWTQDRLLYKLSRYTCLAATQDKPCKSLCLLKQPPTNLKYLPLPSISLCSLFTEASFRLHSGISWEDCDLIHKYANDWNWTLQG